VYVLSIFHRPMRSLSASISRTQILPPFILAHRCFVANPMEYTSMESALQYARNVSMLLLKSLSESATHEVATIGHQLSCGFEAPAHTSDVIVIGSGLSGLTTALRVCIIPRLSYLISSTPSAGAAGHASWSTPFQGGDPGGERNPWRSHPLYGAAQQPVSRPRLLWWHLGGI